MAPSGAPGRRPLCRRLQQTVAHAIRSWRTRVVLPSVALSPPNRAAPALSRWYPPSCSSPANAPVVNSWRSCLCRPRYRGFPSLLRRGCLPPPASLSLCRFRILLLSSSARSSCSSRIRAASPRPAFSLPGREVTILARAWVCSAPPTFPGEKPCAIAKVFSLPFGTWQPPSG